MEFEKCVICLETFDDVSSKKKTVCEHEFHDECLEKWVKQDGTCPICRNVLQKQRWLLKKLRRYFFMGVLFSAILIRVCLQIVVCGFILVSLSFLYRYFFVSSVAGDVGYTAGSQSLSDFCLESENARFCFLNDFTCKSNVAVQIGNVTYCAPILNLFGY